ncbi:MAG: sodium:proline symporter, partial [Gemmatimonadota bacterium]|nr:sodium:proline symporter [Gemmatimonadota bacterium]
LLVTRLTRPASRETLQSFYDKIRPFPGGWRAAVRVDAYDRDDSLPAAFLSWFLGMTVVYSALFGTGFLLYGRTIPGVLCAATVVIAAIGLIRVVPRVRFQ